MGLGLLVCTVKRGTRGDTVWGDLRKQGDLEVAGTTMSCAEDITGPRVAVRSGVARGAGRRWERLCPLLERVDDIPL